MVAQHQLIWTEGLALSQHHFQYAEAHRHYLQQVTAPRWHWGLLKLAIDESALALGWFTVTRLQLIFPNQRVVNFTQSATQSLSLDLRSCESARIPITLAMLAPNQMKGLTGYPDSVMQGAHQVEYIRITDDYDDTRPFEIAVAIPTLLLLAQQDIPYHDQHLTLAIIERSHHKYRLLQEFIPSTIQIDGAPALQQWCGALASACHACSQTSQSLAVILKAASTLFWHFHQQGETHPYDVYLAAVQLLGILSEESLDPHFYHYQHAKLTPLFAELKVHIIRRLQLLQKKGVHHYVAEQQEDRLWCFNQLLIPSWKFNLQLRVRADSSEANWANDFSKSTTIAALEDIMNVIDAHSEGLRLHHQSPVDAAIHYYEIELQGGLWQRIKKLGNLAIYIRSPLDNLELQLDFIPQGESAHD